MDHSSQCWMDGRRSPPVWMMRQAGRYLPEYGIRAKAGGFVALCLIQARCGSNAAASAPLRFDAAILFADILIVPHALA